MNAPAPQTGSTRSRRLSAIATVGVAGLMLGLSFAAVPLYRMFCAVTGYGGTTQRAHVAPAKPGERVMTVRFDSNVGGNLPWAFEPETKEITLRTGETKTVFYRVTNLTDHAISATAAYNVTPDQAGGYFDKLSCFCFSEQTLGPKESAEWPVVFFLDPALEKDEAMKGVDQLTLSYTFFESKKPARSAEQAAPKSRI
ncbi:MAG: cytochrome c oxidase assembly protein [Methylobacteriaceae bacterium]|nr:cytochrome c oxidase assembly protein [Rhodoblastus sp.]MCC0004442.1 cytochrome c oxidase assembly protein [Methylobacteriaceae bacterium]